MSERRKSARQKSFLRGRLTFDHGRSVVTCLVRDLSDDGARLMLSDAVVLPEEVELYIAQKQQTLPARVQWRRGEETGVSFSLARAPAGDELADRVQRLEVEVAALRRMLKRLKAEISSRSDQDAA